MEKKYIPHHEYSVKELIRNAEYTKTGSYGMCKNYQF